MIGVLTLSRVKYFMIYIGKGDLIVAKKNSLKQNRNDYWK